MYISSYSGVVFNSIGNEYVVTTKNLGGKSIIASTNIYKKGDIDGNGNVDLTDVLKLRRYLAMLKTNKNTSWNLNNDEKSRADINGDKVINLNDNLILRRYIAASKSQSIIDTHPDWYWSN